MTDQVVAGKDRGVRQVVEPQRRGEVGLDERIAANDLARRGLKVLVTTRFSFLGGDLTGGRGLGSWPQPPPVITPDTSIPSNEIEYAVP